MIKELSVGDFIVEYLISVGVRDVFGYQGGMVAYLFDSFGKYRDRISYHIPYHEQGGAFSACGYAQASGKIGFLFVTSGPGFTNTLTGIAEAFFDSIPLVVISAQVNTKDKKINPLLRQCGFQEIQATEIAKPICKKVYNINSSDGFPSLFKEAVATALENRKGPVLLDIPINVFRDSITWDSFSSPRSDLSLPFSKSMPSFSELLQHYSRPVIIAGNGIKQSESLFLFRRFAEKANIPVVTSMPGIDILPTDDPLNMGWIGPDARREANLIVSKADFILALGARLDPRQTGYIYQKFSPKAKLVRVDIDQAEFSRKIKEGELDLAFNVRDCLVRWSSERLPADSQRLIWLQKCQAVKKLLSPFDKNLGNYFFEKITRMLPNDSNLVFDVGYNELWASQSAFIQNNTKVFMSAGLGSMGYSLPAAIGVFYGNGHPTFSFNGDGGIQMNIQELQNIAKFKLPIKIIVVNNKALGNVVLFQDRYLGHRYVATKQEKGDYFACNIVDIAKAYGIESVSIESLDLLETYSSKLRDSSPFLLEFLIPDDCGVLPSISVGDDYLFKGPKLPSEIVSSVEAVLNN